MPDLRRAGVIVASRAGECSGAGRVVEERTLKVEVPAGIHDGQRIRLAGEGHAGDSGGRAGDVYVLVRVRPDPRFVREGNDVFSTVDLTIAQAALGARVTVPTLDGETQLVFERGHAAGRGPRPARQAACPCSRASDVATSASSSTSSCRGACPRSSATSSSDSRAFRRRDVPRRREGFFDKLKSAFR